MLALLVGLLVGFTSAEPQHHHGGHPPKASAPKGWNNTHHARPRGHRPVAPVHGRRVHDKGYHTKHGHKFRHGYYYRGWNHNHWSYHYWDSRYGAYLYYDPGVTQYFYWCAPHYRFYPVSYAPVGYVFPFVAQPVAPAVAVPEPPGDGPDDAPPPLKKK